jgi:cellobiose-specific phosphotransferase system component IIC
MIMVIYRVVMSSMAHPGRFLSFCPNLAELVTLTITFVLIAIKIIVPTSTTLCSWCMPVYHAGCALQGVVHRDCLVLSSVNLVLNGV